MYRKKYDLAKIEKIYSKEIKKNNKVVNTILELQENDVDFLAQEERAMPSNDNFQKSGYYLKMLGRYFFAGREFCKNKNVLDSCSGVGWGSYILSHYATSVVAYDFELKAVEFSKKYWKSSNITWIQGDALSEQLLNGTKFDVITAMETIEHFSKEDGEKYIKNCANLLSSKGSIVGSSSFPISKEIAEELRKKNPYHPHIFTYDEILTILNKYFNKVQIIDNWMFIAQK